VKAKYETKVAAVGCSLFITALSAFSQQNWTQATNAPVFSWLSVASSADGTKLVAGGRDQVYTSADAGATWTSNIYSGNVDFSVASSADGSKLAAVTAGVNDGFGVIYLSTNSGMAWLKITNAPTGVSFSCVASSADGTRLITGAGGRVGGPPDYGPIYTSTNSGLTWVTNNVPKNVWASVASSADGSKLVAVCSSIPPRWRWRWRNLYFNGFRDDLGVK
jgi:hypothetical protein